LEEVALETQVIAVTQVVLEALVMGAKEGEVGSYEDRQDTLQMKLFNLFSIHLNLQLAVTPEEVAQVIQVDTEVLGVPVMQAPVAALLQV
jgi:hypothetical protein